MIYLIQNIKNILWERQGTEMMMDLEVNIFTMKVTLYSENSHVDIAKNTCAIKGFISTTCLLVMQSMWDMLTHMINLGIENSKK